MFLAIKAFFTVKPTSYTLSYKGRKVISDGDELQPTLRYFEAGATVPKTVLEFSAKSVSLQRQSAVGFLRNV